MPELKTKLINDCSIRDMVYDCSIRDMRYNISNI